MEVLGGGGGAGGESERGGEREGESEEEREKRRERRGERVRNTLLISERKVGSYDSYKHKEMTGR